MLRIALLAGMIGLGGCYAGTEATPSSPRSLAGTEIDGELRAGANDEFVFDARARLSFDYFLTADVELTSEELDGWVLAEVGRRLPPRAASEAFAAWTAYVSFRGEAAELLAEPGVELGVIEGRLLAAVDEQLGDYAIAAEERAQIVRGFELGRVARMQERDRARALAELREAEGESAAEAFLRGRRAIAGATAEELVKVRREHFGEEAALRLAELDARRADWTRRVEALRGARDDLRTAFVGSPAELEVAIAALEGQAFSPEELRRVRAIDRLTQ